MNRTYECMVLLDNREVKQGWDALKQDVTGMLTKHGAGVVSARLWEERKLAFPIQQQQRGTYLLVYFNSETGAITSINREFNMAEPVLRHLVTACEEVPESAHQPEAQFDVSKIGIEEPPAPEPESEPVKAASKEAATDGGETDSAPAEEAANKKEDS